MSYPVRRAAFARLRQARLLLTLCLLGSVVLLAIFLFLFAQTMRADPSLWSRTLSLTDGLPLLGAGGSLLLLIGIVETLAALRGVERRGADVDG